MFDVTAGRSAGTVINSTLDPTRAAGPDPDALESAEVRDVTAGRAAGTQWNAAKDPTRPGRPGDVRR